MADQRLPFLAEELPARFVRWIVVIEPGAARPYDPAEWRDAIVVVEGGTVCLERRGGAVYTAHEGDVLWLAGMALVELRNCGPQSAILVAVSRRRPHHDGRRSHR